jgi:hypothetical protein
MGMTLYPLRVMDMGLGMGRRSLAAVRAGGSGTGILVSHYYDPTL